MTTRVHVVNLGPDAVQIEKFNPADSREAQASTVLYVLYPGDSYNEYVYDTQGVKVTEKPILSKENKQ